jgi:RTX calcium-binding nonapeptide repeat (4 copies)
MACRVLRAALLVFALGSIGPALAWACTPSAAIDLNGADAGPPGTNVTVNGRGFPSGREVEIHWNGSSGPVLTMATGPAFSVNVTIPSEAPGTHYIVATARAPTGEFEGQAAAAFSVTQAPDPPAPPGDEDPERGGSTPRAGLFAYAPPAFASSTFAGCPASTANVIRGAATASTTMGTGGADRIFAGPGDDVIEALAGDDCVDLGAGADRGGGGPGSDLLLGELGRDRLSGGSGKDRLAGGAGGDRIAAGRGADLAAGDQGNDRLGGGSGADRLQGGSGRDRLNGGPGRDRLSSGSGRDRISARDGDRDRISCGIGFDRIVADLIDRVSSSCERVTRIPAS